MATNYDDLLRQLQPMLNSAGSLDKQHYDQQYKLGKAEIDAAMQRAKISSKDTRYGIEQERDAARERIQQAREDMERIGIPRMEIERYVAEKNYEIAQSEMSFKREELASTTEAKKAQLQLDREQMERVGIPRMEIERYTAQKNYEIQQEQNALARDTLGENRRQFDVGASGYMTQGGQLSAQQQSRLAMLQARDAQLKAAGFGEGVEHDAPGATAEMNGLLDIQSGYTAGPGGGGRMATLDRERFAADEAERARRYGLDVGKFGAELASTPDTYFQARRFQGVDVPRLMGGAGAAPEGGPGAYGAPTPGVATMGAYLSGQDPYGGGGGMPPPGGGGMALRGGGDMALLGGGASPGTDQVRGITDPGFNPNAAAQRGQVLAGGGYGSTPYGGASPRTDQLRGIDDPGFNPNAAAQRGQVLAGGGYGSQDNVRGITDPGFAPPAADDRAKQLAQIAKAVPPSPYDGLNEQDTSALRLMESIYKKGGRSIAGGELERLKGSGRMGYMRSAGRMLGYDPAEMEADYAAYRPAQGASNLA